MSRSVTAAFGVLLKRVRPYTIARTPQRVYIYACMVGVFTGLVATGYTVVLDYLDGALLHEEGSSDLLPGAHWPTWVFLVVPTIGGLLSGLITYFARATDTESLVGGDAMVSAFHNHMGRIRARVPFVKIVATWCTLGSGGSAGSEGPLMQVGAGLGTMFSDFCGLGARARRTLLLAGSAGGLGAMFRSPLGSALTAIEVLYREDFESDAFVPCVISSVTSFTVISLLLGEHHIFEVGELKFHSPIEIVFYAGLALLCLPLGLFYVRFFHGLKRAFARLPLPRPLVPALGGLLLGGMALRFPEVMGTGTRYVQRTLDGGVEQSLLQGLAWFIGLALLKIVATSLTVGSGSSGGVFAPSLFIGGMLGAAVGTLGHALFPEAIPSVAPYVLVGMGAFFAGVANAPLASILMVTEMTGSYSLLPPMMAVAVITLVLSRRFSIYEHQVNSRFDSPAHLWDMRIDVLKRARIRDAIPELSQSAIVRNNMLLFSLEARGRELHTTDFIVTNEAGGYVGGISLRRAVVGHSDALLRNLVILDDVLDDLPVLGPDDNLRDAMQYIQTTDMDKVAVVDDHRQVLGYVSVREVLRAYESAVRKPTDID